MSLPASWTDTVPPVNPDPTADPAEASAPPPSDAAVITGIALVIGAGIADTLIAKRVTKMLVGLGDIPEDAAEAAVKLALVGYLLRRRGANITANGRRPRRMGPAVTGVIEQNKTYLAAFLVNATRRLAKAAQAGQLREGIRRERRFLNQHDQAQEKRLTAARAVDQTARKVGPLMGWYSVLDSRTTTECREAHGSNFYAERRPVIGWPGSVHARCRCRPGRPHDTGRMIP